MTVPSIAAIIRHTADVHMHAADMRRPCHAKLTNVPRRVQQQQHQQCSGLCKRPFVGRRHGCLHRIPLFLGKEGRQDV